MQIKRDSIVPALRFYEKNVYGKTLIYPAKEIKENFASLTGRQTADKTILQSLKNLGFEVIINKADFEVVYF